MDSSVEADVQDMVCAQALAVVGAALKQRRAGEVLVVRYNAPDVERDLLLWAQQLGHLASVVGGSRLRIERGP